MYRTLHQQLADLCILPGALRVSPDFDRHSNGHDWRDTAWRYYQCRDCGMQSHQPDQVGMSCWQYQRVHQAGRRMRSPIMTRSAS